MQRVKEVNPKPKLAVCKKKETKIEKVVNHKKESQMIVWLKRLKELSTSLLRFKSRILMVRFGEMWELLKK